MDNYRHIRALASKRGCCLLTTLDDSPTAGWLTLTAELGICGYTPTMNESTNVLLALHSFNGQLRFRLAISLALSHPCNQLADVCWCDAMYESTDCSLGVIIDTLAFACSTSHVSDWLNCQSRNATTHHTKSAVSVRVGISTSILVRL